MRACRRVAVAPSARAENRFALFAWSQPRDRGRPPRALRLPPPFTFRGDRQPSRPRTQCESGERDRQIDVVPTDPYVIMNVMMIHFNSRSPFTSAQVSIQGSSMYQAYTGVPTRENTAMHVRQKYHHRNLDVTAAIVYNGRGECQSGGCRATIPVSWTRRSNHLARDWDARARSCAL